MTPILERCWWALLLGACICCAAPSVAAEGWFTVEHKRTAAYLHQLGTALESYAEAHGSFPRRNSTDASTLRSALQEHVVRNPSWTDGWGRPLYYMSAGPAYVLWSHGQDGNPDNHPTGGVQADLGADLVHYGSIEPQCSGFWQWPRGLGVLVCEAEAPFERIKRELTRDPE